MNELASLRTTRAVVIPAQAGIQGYKNEPLSRRLWIPACAGMTFLLGWLSFAVCAVAAGAYAPKPDSKLCQALVKNTPDADVAYQPGVDVNGNAVTPADLPGAPQMELPKKITIPLTVNLAKAINLDTSSYPYNQLGSGTEATLGILTVEDDKVSFNGQPLTDAQQDNLAVLCMQPR